MSQETCLCSSWLLQKPPSIGTSMKSGKRRWSFTEGRETQVQAVDNEQVPTSDGVKPQLGASGFFCLELFCGTGNLTYAMKHFFPDSFGVDHKVTKQRVKIVCLDLSKEDHQILVEQWALSGKCLWVHFGVPCGTASRARFRRISRRIHGPPPLRSSRFPDGLPGLKGLHAIKLRAANHLYSYMRKLNKTTTVGQCCLDGGEPFDELTLGNVLLDRCS